jgi:glycosyltransferase involved in cell wall biosynthesis
VRALFVMEQHLGHQTYSENLRSCVAQSDEIDATWAPVRYAQSDARWEGIRWLPAAVRGALRGRREVLRALAADSSDVCFFNTQVPAALAGRRARRRPYLVATDITPIQFDRMAGHYGHRADRPGPIRWLKRRASAAVFRRASAVLPWSDWVAGSLSHDYGVAAERIVVLPPGVDIALWQPPPARVASRRPRILFVGGDFWRKGGRLLLEAFKALRRGEAELAVVTRTELPEEPDVRVFHDMTPNSPALIRLYQSSDVFVLPSEAEAFGIAAVEAAAVGLPVIAAAVGGLADVVVHDVTGLLIPPGDAVALERSLRAMLDDGARARRMGHAGRQRAEARFDARKNGGRVVRLLLEAAGRRR